MSPETKTLIMIILAVTMGIILVIELVYLKRRKQNKKKGDETYKDKAFNVIHTSERICGVLSSQGINVLQAEGLLREARRFEAEREYGIAIEKAEEAKIELMRAKSEHEIFQPQSSEPQKIFLDESVESQQSSTILSLDETELGVPPVIDHLQKDEPPEYYMQAKFMLTTVKDLIDKQEGVLDKQTVELYEDASKNFEAGNYSKALSLAIKAERVLDSSGNVNLIGETLTQQETVDEEIVEVEELTCACGEEVQMDDNFCRKCGEKVEFQFVCPGCDGEIANDDLFCRKCGEKLK